MEMNIKGEKGNGPKIYEARPNVSRRCYSHGTCSFAPARLASEKEFNLPTRIASETHPRPADLFRASNGWMWRSGQCPSFITDPLAKLLTRFPTLLSSTGRAPSSPDEAFAMREGQGRRCRPDHNLTCSWLTVCPGVGLPLPLGFFFEPLGKVPCRVQTFFWADPQYTGVRAHWPPIIVPHA
jgi:hypothetical protein